MELRPELQVPLLDEHKVQNLAELAAKIDGARPGEWEDELAEFNRIAGTSFQFIDFQGIFGGMEHDDWVRNVLCAPFAEARRDLSRDEMLDIITRLFKAEGREYERYFWIRLLEVNLDRRISDLIYWPDKYFGHSNNSREMSPQEILETALKSRQ